MRADDLIPAASDALRAARIRAAAFFTPTLRLGVTGFSGSGKTVFITALVRNLVSGGRLPFFSPLAEGRILRAFLEPQPDDGVPRFEYEDHLARLGANPPDWPESTRRISQLRVTIEYLARGGLDRAFGPSRLHLDIVDYPGEWLLDLAMLDQNYAAWSAEALSLLLEPRRAASAQQFLTFIGTGAEKAERDIEQTALEGAKLFKAYLCAARGAERFSAAGPGRFLMPGDLAGTPLLTFFPLPAEAPQGALRRMLERRFESYKARVARPFFRDHMSRLDRQIVLVDVLSALDAGASAIADTERALTSVLAVFRPGANQWFALFLGRRIDRILFAATKADHLHRSSHDQLEVILGAIADRAIARAAGAGAGVHVTALAAIRATQETEASSGGERLPCIVGVPLPGERLGARVFDGQAQAAVFPGDLPHDAKELFNESAAQRLAGRLRFPRFRPWRIPAESPAGAVQAWPHIRLDRALDVLLADKLS